MNLPQPSYEPIGAKGSVANFLARATANLPKEARVEDIGEATSIESVGDDHEEDPGGPSFGRGSPALPGEPLVAASPQLDATPYEGRHAPSPTDSLPDFDEFDAPEAPVAPILADEEHLEKQAYFSAPTKKGTVDRWILAFGRDTRPLGDSLAPSPALSTGSKRSRRPPRIRSPSPTPSQPAVEVVLTAGVRLQPGSVDAGLPAGDVQANDASGSREQLVQPPDDNRVDDSRAPEQEKARVDVLDALEKMKEDFNGCIARDGDVSMARRLLAWFVYLQLEPGYLAQFSRPTGVIDDKRLASFAYNAEERHRYVSQFFRTVDPLGLDAYLALPSPRLPLHISMPLTREVLSRLCDLAEQPEPSERDRLWRDGLQVVADECTERGGYPSTMSGDWAQVQTTLADQQGWGGHESAAANKRSRRHLAEKGSVVGRHK